MTKAIVFDLWHTLAYEKSMKENPVVTTAKILGKDFNFGFMKRVEVGFMLRKFSSEREAMESLCRKLGVDPDGRLVDSLKNVWFSQGKKIVFFPEVIPSLESLKKKRYKLALLSNTDCFSMGSFIDKRFLRLFDVLAFSFEIGKIKPDRRIFTWTLERLGTRPEEAVMVGDNIGDDLEPAGKIGMKCVLMRREGDQTAVTQRMGSYGNTIRSLDELENFL